MDVEYLWATPLFTSSISESLRASTASSVLSLRGVPDASGNWSSHMTGYMLWESLLS